MGLYIFQNPQTLEIKEVFQNMNDVHEFEEGGIKWGRVFVAPGGVSDTRIDPFDSKAFVSKTYKNKDTLGSMFDLSRELSEKRIEKEGHDSVREKWFENYSKIRKGKKHPFETRRKRQELLGF